MKIERKYEEELEEAVGDCRSLLDVGCGSDSPIQTFSGKLDAVGVDLFDASLAKSADRKIHNRYVQADVRALADHFAERSFDCVLASEVIEHLTKEEGERFLGTLERIARRRVIVFTPNGFLPQGQWESNPWQVHKSGWSVEDMRQRGYRVIGLRGWKPLRGECATIRFRPKFLWLFLSSLTQRWVRNRPEKAFQILCIKDFTSKMTPSHVT
jgi:SAM-dependent methyltransferase